MDVALPTLADVSNYGYAWDFQGPKDISKMPALFIEEYIQKNKDEDGDKSWDGKLIVKVSLTNTSRQCPLKTVQLSTLAAYSLVTTSRYSGP